MSQFPGLAAEVIPRITGDFCLSIELSDIVTVPILSVGSRKVSRCSSCPEAETPYTAPIGFIRITGMLEPDKTDMDTAPAVCRYVSVSCHIRGAASGDKGKRSSIRPDNGQNGAHGAGSCQAGTGQRWTVGCTAGQLGHG